MTVVGQGNHLHSYQEKGITIFPIKPFKRLSIRRLTISWRLLFILRKIKPDALTVHTPELLWVGWMMKWFLGTKVLYDVHENYKENILYGAHYPNWLKKPLAALVRGMEKRAVRWLTGVSYAELSYDNMLQASDEQKVVLRNSYAAVKQNDTAFSLPDTPYLLYTGTLARAWGVMETLILWKKIQEIRSVPLVIAGFGYDQQLLEEVADFVKETGYSDRFRLIGGTTYVPYEQIAALIKGCWFGTGLYHPLPQTLHKLPTKFYEYAALGKPLLFTHTPYWTAQNKLGEFGIPYETDVPMEALIEAIENWQPIPDTQRIPYTWSHDEHFLKEALSRWLDSLPANQG